MAYTFYEGATLRFTTASGPFTSISGTVVNPDVVTFSYSVQGQTEVTYTFTQGSGDPQNMITNPTTGVFQIDLSTTGLAGTWAYKWSGQPNGGTDSTKTSAVWTSEVIVSAVRL